jgi:hypothetical protein
LTGIAKSEAILIDSIDWGEIWRVDIPDNPKKMTITLRTNWIIKDAMTIIPSLVSCFIKI